MSKRLIQELTEIADGPPQYDGEKPWESRGEYMLEELFCVRVLGYFNHPDDLPVIEWLACGDFFSSLAITCAEAAKRIAELEAELREATND